MDIKTRIDTLSEVEAEAALIAVYKNNPLAPDETKKLLLFLVEMAASCYPDGQCVLQADRILSEALEEAQHGHKNED